MQQKILYLLPWNLSAVNAPKSTPKKKKMLQFLHINSAINQTKAMPSSITSSRHTTQKNNERKVIQAVDMMHSIACLQIPVIVASGP